MRSLYCKPQNDEIIKKYDDIRNKKIIQHYIFVGFIQRNLSNSKRMKCCGKAFVIL